MIQTTGKHRGVKLLATVDYATGKIVWREDEDYTAETFLIFLRQVLGAYPTGKIVMILDNASIHHVFLPAYSPQLNIVEGLLKWLKSDVINNVFYHTVDAIRKVQTFMDNIMLDPMKIIDRLCVRLESGHLVNHCSTYIV